MVLVIFYLQVAPMPTSHPDASYQVSSQLAQRCRRSTLLKQLLTPHEARRTTQDARRTLTDGSQSIRTQINSYSSQLALILVNSYSSTWSIRTHLVNSYSLFGQFVLILVNSSSFCQLVLMFIGQFELILGPLFWDANKRRQNKIYLTPLKRKIKSIWKCLS